MGKIKEWMHENPGVSAVLIVEHGILLIVLAVALMGIEMFLISLIVLLGAVAIVFLLLIICYSIYTSLERKV